MNKPLAAEEVSPPGGTLFEVQALQYLVKTWLFARCSISSTRRSASVRRPASTYVTPRPRSETTGSLGDATAVPWSPHLYTAGVDQLKLRVTRRRKKHPSTKKRDFDEPFCLQISLIQLRGIEAISRSPNPNRGEIR